MTLHRVYLREASNDVVLELDDEEHCTFHLCDAVVQRTGRHGYAYISLSVVQQMVNTAYEAGANKAAKQLQQIRNILEVVSK